MMLRAAGKRLAAGAGHRHAASPAVAARRWYHERGGPLQQPAQRGGHGQGRPGRGHGARRRAGVRGRHEAADPRRRRVGEDRRRALQDLRLRLRHRVVLCSVSQQTGLLSLPSPSPGCEFVEPFPYNLLRLRRLYRGLLAFGNINLDY
jgi:hypothetical protein